MTDICFYFQVHQPYRLRHYSFFDIGMNPFYEDEDSNRGIMLKVAQKCYLPMNKLLLKLINKYAGRFKVSFSISGTALDQFEAYAPVVLKSFQELVDTGCVELLGETSHHSLSFIYSREEFKKQVEEHTDRLKSLFGFSPEVFRNTSVVYNNDLARSVHDLGFKGVFTEGATHILGWKSPNYLYKAPDCDIRLLLKNYRLSDDIAFRFSWKDWLEYPLTADKYSGWLNSLSDNADIINLFMNYETFGEHHWNSTGIFEFMEALPRKVFEEYDFNLSTASEAINRFEPRDTLDVPEHLSWEAMEDDQTAWLGNEMQKDSIQTLYQMEERVQETDRDDLYKTWKRLQTSDHMYYMSTKWFSDGEAHNSYNPYGTPYEAYINYMNVLSDFDLRLTEALVKPVKAKKATKKSSIKAIA